jgi:hypothetical protein
MASVVTSLELLHKNIQMLEKQQIQYMTMARIKKPEYNPKADAEELRDMREKRYKASCLMKATCDFFQMVYDCLEKSKHINYALVDYHRNDVRDLMSKDTEQVVDLNRECVVSLLKVYGTSIDVECLIYLVTDKVFKLRVHDNSWLDPDDLRNLIVSALLSTGLISKQRADDILP